MSKAITFEGSIVVNGFPRNTPFSFDVQEDRIVLKAGREVFLTVEKEPLPETESQDSPQLPTTLAPTPGIAPETTAESKSRKERAPNFKPDTDAAILIPADFRKEYTKAREKWYETLKTANRRTVSWWLNSSMVRALEGSPTSMLKFFLDEGAVTLVAQHQIGRQTQPEQVATQQAQGPLPTWAPTEQAGNVWGGIAASDAGSLPPASSAAPGGSRFLG